MDHIPKVTLIWKSLGPWIEHKSGAENLISLEKPKSIILIVSLYETIGEKIDSPLMCFLQK